LLARSIVKLLHSCLLGTLISKDSDHEELILADFFHVLLRKELAFGVVIGRHEVHDALSEEYYSYLYTNLVSFQLRLKVF
jgi:hypothetical protein